MNPIDLIVLNFQEVRRRSLKVWSGIPADMLEWKPDENAMSCKQTMRHVLEIIHFYHYLIIDGGDSRLYNNPHQFLEFNTIEEELRFFTPIFDNFINNIKEFGDADLKTIMIKRPDKGYTRSLGDFLMRAAYHEAVHTGQLLLYLRMMNVERPNIWD